MIKRKIEKGVGLVEVLVALIILALGVLGFSALQLRALDAAQEATAQTVAMNTARDLVERIRVNRTALARYRITINAQTIDEDKLACNGTISRDASPATTKIDLPKCNPSAMAEHDATEILKKAKSHGQVIVMANCVASSMSCVYVAWAPTTITATNISQCVNTTTGTYIVDAKCLVMEAF